MNSERCKTLSLVVASAVYGKSSCRCGNVILVAVCGEAEELKRAFLVGSAYSLPCFSPRKPLGIFSTENFSCENTQRLTRHYGFHFPQPTSPCGWWLSTFVASDTSCVGNSFQPAYYRPSVMRPSR